MTPLPGALGTGELVAWRLDQANYAATWDSGEGAYRFGGRWNSRGVRAVYSAIDPATAILEMAVHKGFAALDTVPHVLSAVTVVDIDDVHIVHHSSVPNPNWLHPGVPGRGQQLFGNDLLSRHRFVLIPSTVSVHSWNLVFAPDAERRAYRLVLQEPFALDTRLHPPAAS